MQRDFFVTTICTLLSIVAACPPQAGSHSYTEEILFGCVL